jgi:hypothetical protein
MSVMVDESVRRFDTTLEFAVICNDELVGTTSTALQTTGRSATANPENQIGSLFIGLS